jgi:hypothetical protein
MARCTSLIFTTRIIGHYEVPLTHPGRDRTSGRISAVLVYKEKPLRSIGLAVGF